MELAQWSSWVGFFVMTAGFAFTLYKFLHSEKLRREEIVRRQKAEAELDAIARRGEGPRLFATHLHVPRFEKPIGPDMTTTIYNQILGNGQTVDPEKIIKGLLLVLDLANEGPEVFNVTDDWPEGEGISCQQRTMQARSSTAAQLCYHFDPALLGQKRRIRIDFVTATGRKTYHVYEIVYGKCELTLIDPA